MRRIGIVVVLLASLLGVALAASATASAALAARPMANATLTASATASAPPRGVLTKVEYRELYASFEAMKHVGKAHGTLTYVARHTCRALTDVSRLTTAERGECEASIIYSYEFFAFPYATQQCAKRSTAPARTRCELSATSAFEKSVRAFMRRDAASVRATTPRHFTRKCLAYLVFTPLQARATSALSAGLRHYAHALRSGKAGAITSTGTRLDSDLVNQRQAMSLNISVSVCRHE
jgi:hypothetical protein